jgi:hypothetical protein
MRRDMDVIRQLLLHIESDDVFDGSSTGTVDAAEVGPAGPGRHLSYEIACRCGLC